MTTLKKELLYKVAQEATTELIKWLNKVMREKGLY